MFWDYELNRLQKEVNSFLEVIHPGELIDIKYTPLAPGNGHTVAVMASVIFMDKEDEDGDSL
jgi:Protein of unknown function (DUF2758).